MEHFFHSHQAGREALQMVQDNCFTLRLGKVAQRTSQDDQLFGPLHLLAR